MTAIQLVSRVGADSQSLRSGIVAALKDDAQVVREAALQVVGPGTPEAVPVLVEALKNPSLQAGIFDALTKIGPAAEPAVPQLLELLPTALKENRLKIFSVLAITRSAAGLPSLSKALQDEDTDIRTAAIAAYAKAERDQNAIVVAALPMLHDADRKVRRAAATAIGQTAERGRDAAGELVALLDNTEDRSFALETLRRVQLRDVPQLVTLLDHRDESVRAFACERLGRLGADGRDAIPALRQVAAAQSQPELVQREARRALRQLEAQ
jgi:HEAT repeat protein